MKKVGVEVIELLGRHQGDEWSEMKIEDLIATFVMGLILAFTVIGVSAQTDTTMSKKPPTTQTSTDMQNDMSMKSKHHRRHHRKMMKRHRHHRKMMKKSMK